MAFNSRRLTRRVAAGAVCALAALSLCSFADRHPSATAQAPRTFASHVASLSEEGGYFDTDNLISNERS